MIKIRLVTSNDGLAAEVEIPPFATWPDVLVWGSRIFLKTNDEGVYREGFAYHVPMAE